ncbi:MAG TPA: hypothetical protein VM433_02755 [Mycobacteriales bacterium]|jgi:hypothetical protein|nr:hypothetical protein [Mycobacteriales bacterium]
MTDPRSNHILTVLEEQHALAIAWNRTDPAELAGLLRSMPPKQRNRVLSAHRTPSSKVSATTARLLVTNVNRAGPSERRRAASYICQPVVADLGVIVHDAAVCGEDAADVLGDLLENLASDVGPTVVTLAAVVGCLAEPDRIAPVVAAAVRLGFTDTDVAGAVAGIFAAADELFAEHVARHGDLADDGVAAADDLVTLWAAARDAAGRVRDVVGAGELPDPDDLAAVSRYGQELAGLAQRLSVEPAVPAVLDALEAAATEDAHAAAVQKLRGLRGPAQLADEIVEVVDAVERGVDAGTAGRLARLADLLDDGDPMVRFEIAAQLRGEPSPPAPALVDAALAGVLELADVSELPDAPEVPHVDEPAAEGIDTDADTDSDADDVGASAEPVGESSDGTSPPGEDAPDVEAPSGESTPGPAEPAEAVTAVGSGGDAQTVVVDHGQPSDEDGEPDQAPDADPVMPHGKAGEAAGSDLADQRDKVPADAAASDGKSDDGTVNVVFDEVVAASRFSLAHHLAAVVGHDHRAGILAEAALAHAVRSPGSPSAAAMIVRVAETPVAAGDRGSLVLRAVSLIRVALLDPSSGAPSLLRQLVPPLESMPQLQALAVAVAIATEQNLSLPAGGVTVDASEALEQAHAIASWAEDTLHRQFRQNRLYRGIEIWKAWTSGDGTLGQILSAVADDDPARVAEVRALCEPIMQRHQQAALLDATDRALRDGRAGAAKKIMGAAREQLLRHLAETVNQAVAWCDAHETAAGNQRSLDVRAELAAAVDRLRGPVTDEVAAVCDGPWAAAAGAAAVDSLTATFGLFRGEGLTRPDMDPDAALNRALTLTDAPLLEPDFTLRDLPTAAQLVAAARRSRADAFQLRLSMWDFVGAEAVLDLTIPPDGAFHETDARQQLASAERDARRKMEERWRHLDRRFAAGRSRGRVSEDDAARLYGALLQARPESPETGTRRDLGAVRDELDRIAADLDDAVEVRRARVHADVQAALAEGAVAGAWAEKLTELLGRDELGAAEEYLHRAAAGDSPPDQAEAGKILDDELAGVVGGLEAPLDRSVVDAARDGRQVGPFDFSNVDVLARPGVADALDAWWRLSRGERPDDLDTLLEQVLGLLGLIPTKLARPAELRAASTKSRWLVDVHGDRSGYAFVPDFGSRALGRRRFLLCWEDLPVSQLWDFAAANAPVDQPMYVLWMGALSSQQRVELARQARRRGTGQVVVIDDAVILRCALEGRQAFDVTMRAVLPYAAPNPYDPDLLVNTPEEMFYGRQAERRMIAAPAGSSFISGGRRLGKSALLPAVQQSLNGTDVVALLIVIQHVAATEPRDPDELWSLLASRLIEVGVLPAGTVGTSEAVAAGVRAWLADNPERRLLLMLDECDFFLQADANSSFRNVAALRDLMSDAGRFKVVFSGLQHVARYRKLPNQPLSHLPQPLVIGPLDTSAASRLVRQPLHVLGWDITPDQVDRIVTFCACNASVLQLACGQLVERLREQPVDGLAPWPVPDEVLNDLLRSSDLADGVRDRLFLTLELDHRYKLLAYLMAWRAANDGLGSAVSAGELRRQAVDYWPEGFASQGTEDVRALCDELVGLGVFAGDAEAGYRMLSPATVRLFGSPEDVEAELLSASELYEPDPAAGASGSRMRLDAGERDERRFSPLTAAQLADVVGAGRTQLRVVVGSRALRTESVAEALGAAAGRLPDASVLEVSSLRQWREAMTAPPDGHRVVVSDMTASRSPESWEASLDAARRRGTARTSRGTRAGVLVAGPADRWLLRRLVATPAAAGDLAHLAVGLRRVDLTSLRAWDRIEELDVAHPARQQRLLSVTGGWPHLVERVLARTRQRSFDDVLDDLAAHLGTPEGAAELVAAVGLDVADPDQPADAGLVATFARLAEHGWREADLAELLELDDELADVEADPAEAVAILSLLGLIEEDDEGLLGPEPVVAASVRRRLPAPA